MITSKQSLARRTKSYTGGKPAIINITTYIDNMGVKFLIFTHIFYI